MGELTPLTGEERFRPGRLAVSTQGKDRGSWYVLVGVDPKKARFLLVDGKRCGGNSPKGKNPRHVRLAREFLPEVAECVAAGKSIESGWLAGLLNRMVSRQRARNEEVD